MNRHQTVCITLLALALLSPTLGAREVPFDPSIVDSDITAVRGLDAASIHYADVQAGTLQADEVDQTNPMLDWLVDQMSLHEQGGSPGDGKATLELTGFWPILRPGDRVQEARDPGTAANGEAQAITRSNTHIHSIDARQNTPRRGGRTTRIELTF